MRIAVLPDDVIDQIAAGEVVERPASVVKELVDNAIDAGARSVSIDVDGGGRRQIRVVDDGCGMSPEEARLALARHATSKLRAVADLFELRTLGFRGEALPAIASVSKLTLTTRRTDDLAATRLAVDSGRLIDEVEVGAPAGTTIDVEDLLHNVPARLKFLRGEPTEASHVTETVARIALAYPAIHFRLRHGGRVALDAPPVGDPMDRVRDVLGARTTGAMIAVHGEETGIRVVAYLAPPDLAQTTARGVQLFVGKRPVRDRNLLHAVAMGYGELVPRGRYPVAVVMIDVPDGAVDINVHPQKLEVRFGDPAAVAAAVRHVVRRGVATSPWLHGATASAPVQMHAVAAMAPPSLIAGHQAHLASASARSSLGRNAEASSQLGLESWADRMRAQIAQRSADRALVPSPSPTLPPSPSPSPPSPSPPVADSLFAPNTPTEVEGRPLDSYFSRLRYLDQLDRTYLVCEGDGELVLIDQHVAHERVEYQRLLDRANDPATQRLLFPTTIELPPSQLAAAVDDAASLAAVGFEVEPFGRTTLAIKAVPAGLRDVDPVVVLRELLDPSAKRAHRDHLLATIACHSVVRAGDLLGEHEARALLAAMDGVDFRTHSPHGRPVILRFDIAEIARRFGR